MSFASLTPSIPKTRIAVSACLLGKPVRYDGSHKYALENLSKELLKLIDWVEICPEVHMGLSTPRPAMKLYANNSSLPDIRIVESNKNLKDSAIKSFSQLIANTKNIDLWILKSKSPSCGLNSTPIYKDHNLKEQTIGHGLFVEILFKQDPQAIVYDESVLQNDLELKKAILPSAEHLNH